MEYLLHHIEGMAEEHLFARHEKDHLFTEEDLAKVLLEAVQETEKIRSSIVQQAFQHTKAKETETLIQNYQAALTALLDKLFEHQKAAGEHETKDTLIEGFETNILSLLSFIEERFSKYFDRDAKVPAIYLSLVKKEMAVNLEKINGAPPMQATEEKIFSEIISSIRSFAAHDAQQQCSYRDIMYRKELIGELSEMVTQNQEKALFRQLDRSLIYINHNDKSYINHKVNHFAADLERHPDINDRTDHLLLLAKELNQMQVKPDSALNPKHPSVKEQLSNWLIEELFYLEKKVGLLNVPAKSKTKIISHLSVDQISILVRAATDVKAISSDSQRSLFSHIAPFLSTQHKKEISADSMRSKSYSPEQRDLDSVKDVLMKMYKAIGKY